jgi:DNA-directed RNA polymerase specialized sigma24 family protein
MTPETLTKLTKAINDASATRNAAIVQAALEGMTRADICAATGLSDEQVRRIERAGNVPPRAAGRPRSRTRTE